MKALLYFSHFFATSGFVLIGCLSFIIVAYVSGCSNTQTVTSYSELSNALICAEAQETTEIILNGAIYSTSAISIRNTPHLSIRGNTVDARLEYGNNLQGNRLFSIYNSEVMFSSLSLIGDAVMGCLALNDSVIQLREVFISPNSNSNTQSTSLVDGLGIFMINSTVWMEDSMISGWVGAQYGGGVYLQGESNLTMLSSTISRNSATQSGGGVFASPQSEVFVRDDCLFEENQAVYDGGAISVHSLIEVTDSLFHNNSGSRGGALYVMSLVTAGGPSAPSFSLTNVTLVRNIASSAGGALFFNAGGTLMNVTCRLNTGTALGGCFSLIGSHTLSAERLVVTDNAVDMQLPVDMLYTHAKGGGGAVMQGARLTCRLCLFARNSADEGGGLVLLGLSTRAVFEFCNFVFNSAGTGAAVYQEYCGENNFTSCEFIDNAAQDAAGAIYSVHSSPLLLSLCTFFNNSCSGPQCQGGSVSLSAGHLLLSGVVIESSYAMSGGAMSFESATVVIQDTIISNCASNFLGGAIATYSNTDVEVTRSTIQNCHCGQSGGGIFSTTSSKISVSDSLLLNLTSLGSGGVMHVEFYSVVSIDKSTLRGNVGVEGGVLLLDRDSQGFINNSFISFNFALSGGVCISRSSEVRSFNNTYEDNSAEVGGAFSLTVESDFRCDSDKFTRNFAQDMGGTIAVESGSVLHMSRSTVEGSRAPFGGAISVSSESLVDIFFTTFEGNGAKYAGGAFEILLSSSCYFYHVVLKNNFAQRGGSIALGGARLDFVHSECVGGASLSGGCIYTEDFSVINAEESVFSNSTALLGAVVYAVMSDMNFTSCLFSLNHAADAQDRFGLDDTISALSSGVNRGGVICATLCSIIVEGCTATSNYAQLGGFIQLRLSDFQSLNSMYFNNSGVNGGVFHANAKSKCTMDGNRFLGNTASEVGALVFGDDFGVFEFIDSDVDSGSSESSSLDLPVMIYLSFGRAIFNDIRFINSMNTKRSSIIESRQVDFSLRRCSFDSFSGNSNGAAIRLSEGVRTVIESSSFVNNRGGLGGALAVSNTANISITGCNFKNNSAVSGGAIYALLSSLLISDTIFERNVARDGGGCLYWSESEVTFENNTLVENRAQFGPDKASNPKNLFIVNSQNFSKPQNSGRKIDIPVIMVLQDFYGQVVSYADAAERLSIVITASTEDVFSSISGSTILLFDLVRGYTEFTDLVVTYVPNRSVIVSFDAQGSFGIQSVDLLISLRQCKPGETEITLSDTQSKCEKCPFGSYSLNPADKFCTPCPKDATCPGGTAISPNKGFWRQCESCIQIKSCLLPYTCRGGVNVSEQCVDGHTGPLCSACLDGYSRSLKGSCSSCTSSSASINVAVQVLCALMIVSVLLMFIFRNTIKVKLKDFWEKLKKRLNNWHWKKHRTKVKIMIAFVQISSGIPSLLTVDFHYSFTAFLDIMGYISFGFFQTLDLGCYFKYNFYTALRVSTLIPPCMMLVIELWLRMRQFVAYRINSAAPAYTYKQRNVDRKRFFLFITFFIFSTVSTQIFETFVCETFENGKSYLIADVNLECYTPEHKRNMAYAGFMIFFYPVGIPLYYGYHLYKKKLYINPPTNMVVREDERNIVSQVVIQAEKIKLRNTYAFLDGQQFLYESYLPKCWYFEMIECFRRLSLTALPILFLRSTILQVILVLLISLGFSALYMTLHPYAIKSDNTVAILSQWAVSMTVIGAMCMKIDSTNEDSGEFDKLGVAVILIMINTTIFIFTLYASVQDGGKIGIEDESDDTKVETSNESPMHTAETAKVREVDSDDEIMDEDSPVETKMKDLTNVRSLAAFEEAVMYNRRVSVNLEEKELAEMKEMEYAKRKSKRKSAMDIDFHVQNHENEEANHNRSNSVRSHFSNLSQDEKNRNDNSLGLNAEQRMFAERKGNEDAKKRKTRRKSAMELVFHVQNHDDEEAHRVHSVRNPFSNFSQNEKYRNNKQIANGRGVVDSDDDDNL